MAIIATLASQPVYSAIMQGMNQNFAVQGCAVVAPERLSDRLMSVRVLGLDESTSGTQVVLAYVVEVTKPWFASARILDAIRETIEQEYPKLTPGERLVDQFEGLLKSLNIRLNRLSEDGETDWIGNFNALILVIAGDELHFSQSGYCPTYILQNNRIRQITDSHEAERDNHPLKTFSNLASGTLQENDTILLANPELYREISLDALRRILQNYSPYKSCDTIAKELKKEKNPAVAVVILKSLSQQPPVKGAPEPTEVRLEDILQGNWTRIKKRLRPLMHATKDAARTFGQASVEAAKQTRTVVKDKVAPSAGALLQKSTEHLKQVTDKIAATDAETAAEPESSSAPAEEETLPDSVALTDPAVAQENASGESETDAEPVVPPLAVSESVESVVEIIPPRDQRESTALNGQPDVSLDEESTEASSPSPAAGDTATDATEETAADHDTDKTATAEKGESGLVTDEVEEIEPIVPRDELILDTGLAEELSRAPKPADPVRPASADWQSRLRTVPRRYLMPLVGRIILWLQPPKHRRFAALALAVLLIAASGVIVKNRREPAILPASASQNTQLLSQASTLKDEIVTAIDLKQDIEASRKIEEVNRILDSLQDLTADQKKEADTIWSAVQQQTDLITKTIRFTEPVATVSFSSEVNGFIAGLPYFYGYSTNGSSLMRTGFGDPAQTQAETSLGNSADAVISLTKSTSNTETAFALTRMNKVFRVTQSEGATRLVPVSPQSDSGSFEVGYTIGTFNGNLYILDGKTGLLWRYGATDNGFAKGVSIIDINTYDIKKSVSMAIDGSIYLLKQDGSALKFLNGRQQDFSLRDVPNLQSKMIQPLQILTDENMRNIYVLDGGKTSGRHSTSRILEFDKNGVFLRQFGFPPTFTKVQAFDINPHDKKIWVLNGSEISEFSF
jgi:hypothetical protein